MANNFTKRLIDANTGLADTTFYCAGGLAGNTGGVNDPYQVPLIGNLLTNFAVLGNDQIYGDLVTNKGYYGDRQAIIDGLSTESRVYKLRESEYLYFRFFQNLSINSDGETDQQRNMIYEDIGATTLRNAKRSIAGKPTCSNFFFKNTNISNEGLDFTRFPHRIARSIFFSSGNNNTYTIPDIVGKSDFQDSCAFFGYQIVCNSEQIEKFRNCYFENVDFIIDGTPYVDLTALQLAIPTACPNAVTLGAAFVGDLNRNEYHAVDHTSTLLSAGYSGENIGGVRLGVVFNETNVQSSHNITFSGGAFTLTDPLQDGEIVWEGDGQRTFVNPVTILNGTPDFNNNIVRADGNLPEPNLPRKLTFEIETKQVGGVFGAKRFQGVGMPIGIDENNKESGEDDYHAIGIQREEVFGYRPTLTIKKAP